MDDQSISRAEYDKLKEQFDAIQSELKESKSTVVDLTQALATVTVEKTKLEAKVKRLTDSQSSTDTSSTAEIEKLKTELAKVTEQNESLTKELEALKEKESTRISEVDMQKEANKNLTDEIKKLKDKLQTVNEHNDNLIHNNKSLSDEVTKLKKDLDKEIKEKDLTNKSLSERIIELEETVDTLKLAAAAPSSSSSSNVAGQVKEANEEEKVEGVEETDEGIPVDEGRKEETNEQEIDVIQLKPEESTDIEKETAAVEEKKSEREIASAERESTLEEIKKEDDSDIFVPIKTVRSQLKCVAEKHRSQLSSQRKVKKPSKEHVKSLANLSIYPEDMPKLVPYESDSALLRETPPKPEPAKQPMTAPRPKPRPRKKPTSPEHVPTPASEMRSSKTPPDSPQVAKRPIPVPRSVSKDIFNDSGTPEDLHSPQANEKQSPMLPPKPAKHETNNESTRPASQDEPDTVRVPTPSKKPKPVPPKPQPRPSSINNEENEDMIEALKRKDPSELTVKEKRMLAQQAMNKQAAFQPKPGFPPPIRKKPKPPPVEPSHDDHANEEMESSMERSKSMEDLDETTTVKKQPHKLPPGAFKIAIPMGLPGDLRHRSYTVGSGTSEEQPPTSHTPVSQTNEEEEEEESANVPEDSPKSRSNSQSTPRRPSDSISKRTNEETEEMNESTKSSPEIAKKNPPSNSASMDNLSGLSGDELDDPDFDQNELMKVSSAGSLGQPDVEQILYWSPEVVGIWLSSIGLGASAINFKEKGIKGYMMFDLDSSKLKSLGVASNDDRNTFKKELKALKPYADKLKREYEKKKKDEKKQQDIEKKQAKKKKK